jgi:hypothetical protein
MVNTNEPSVSQIKVERLEWPHSMHSAQLFDGHSAILQGSACREQQLHLLALLHPNRNPQRVC